MPNVPDLILELRAERGGADVALDDGLCGLGEATARTLAGETLRRVGVAEAVAIDVLVTDDAVLRRLNRDYRGRDEVTDVLSFPLLEAPLAHAPANQLWGAAEEDDARPAHAQAARDAALGTLVALDQVEDGEPESAADAGTFIGPPDLPLHLGDIVIARGAVGRQAAAGRHSAAWELAFLLAHGILHLVGFDDHTEAGYAAMIAHQEAALSAVGLSK